jgi:hypothetical protein
MKNISGEKIHPDARLIQGVIIYFVGSRLHVIHDAKMALSKHDLILIISYFTFLIYTGFEFDHCGKI